MMMNVAFVVIVMVSVGSLVDVLRASFKGERYGLNSYIPLVTHSIVWALCVMLPLIFTANLEISAGLFLLMFLNAEVHACSNALSYDYHKYSTNWAMVTHFIQIVASVVIIVLLF